MNVQLRDLLDSSLNQNGEPRCRQHGSLAWRIRSICIKAGSTCIRCNQKLYLNRGAGTEMRSAAKVESTTNPHHGWQRTAARIVLPIIGGYALMEGMAGSLSLALLALGVSPVEATLSGTLTAFLFYTGMLIWGFQEARVGRLLVVFVLAPVVLIGIAMFLQQTIHTA